MNVKLLRKIQKYILAEPRRLNMSQWGVHFDVAKAEEKAAVLKHLNINCPVPIKSSHLPPCGTAGCIAGTAFVLGKSTNDLKAFATQLFGETAYRLPYNTLDEAVKLLGLSYQEAERLFFVPGIHEDLEDGWPESFAKRYVKAKTPKTRAKVTCERIDHFIKTKGAE